MTEREVNNGHAFLKSISEKTQSYILISIDDKGILGFSATGALVHVAYLNAVITKYVNEQIPVKAVPVEALEPRELKGMPNGL